MSRIGVALALVVFGSWVVPAAGYPGMGKTKGDKAGALGKSSPVAAAGAPGPGAKGHEHDFGKITGRADIRVTKPDGKPYARAKAELTIAVHGKTKKRLQARADARGRVVFRKVPLGEHAVYTATVKYQGVSYFSRLQFSAGKRSAKAVLSVAPKTSKMGQLRIERAHIILDPSRQGISVVEFVILLNPGKATYAAQHGVEIPLFHGATNLQARQATQGTFEIHGGHTLIYKGSVRPGKTQIQYSYDMPLQGALKRATKLPIDKLSVILTRANFRLSGGSLRNVRKMTRNKVSFLMGEGGPIAAGAPLSFSITPPQGVMAAAQTSGGGGRMGGPEKKLVKDWRVVAKWLSPLVILFIFFIVVYLASRREDDHLALADEAALVAERERLLALLAQVTREVEGGNKASARRQEQITLRLARVYRLIDQHAARRAFHATAGSQPR